MLQNKLYWFCGNNVAKFICYQILADTSLIKLKYNENINVIFPINILMAMELAIFVWHPGPYTNLNTTLG